jgi:hypothetical protein
MSNYESQWGSIKLPTAEFTRIRKSFETGAKSKQAESFEHTQRFWKGLTRKQQTDPGEYDKARRAYISSAMQNRDPRDVFARPDETVANQFEDLTYIPTRWDREANRSVPMRKPARVKQSDVDWANNRTTEFHGGEATVTFDRDASTMRWHTGDNNRAVETAFNSWLGRKVFEELRKVRWSRGTGGSFRYKDEYSDGSKESAGFGPLGFVQAPTMARDYVDTKGVRHSASANLEKHIKAQHKAAEAYQKSQAQQRKGQQGVPTTNGGHFGYSTRGESSRGLGGGSHLG